MKVLILTRRPASYTTRRLAFTARRLGHEVVVGDPLTFAIRLSRRRPELYLDRRPVGGAGVVLARLPAIQRAGLAVVRQFEQLGVRCVNSADTIARAHDKLTALQHLIRNDIDVPPTAFVSRVEEVRFAIDLVGGAPVVVKALDVGEGRGVMLAESVDSAVSLVEALTGVMRPVLVQKFIGEASGVDLRALVVGGRVVAATRVEAPAGEFRASASPDAVVRPVTLSREHEEIAARACRVLGLDVGGVDMLDAAHGPMVLDVNASPGIRELEEACGMDVAREIVALAVSLGRGARSQTA